MLATYHKSGEYIPEKLRGIEELTSFRYIPDCTEQTRNDILSAMQNKILKKSVLDVVPRKLNGEWENTQKGEEFLSLILEHDQDPIASRAVSRLVDDHLTSSLEHGVLVVPNAISEEVLQSFETRKPLKTTTYESMPTTVFAEVIGGNSLAMLHISEGDPELTCLSHSHNGSRFVVAMSENAVLVLPSGRIELKRGDGVWMDPWTMHSFQQGVFLAVHTSEAGWNHPEAFNPLPYDTSA